jgi:aspartate/methionine/tyrosine aminotransferase
MQQAIGPFLSFFNGPIAAAMTRPGVANFAVGNPTEMPLPGYVSALHKWLEPQSPDWFAYKLSEPKAQSAVARSLTARTGLDWDPADVAMTNGGFAAIAVALRAIVEPGDEVVFLTPPWFFYEVLILAAGGVPVRVPLAPPAFDIDPATIEAAITPRTRAVLLNTPHNPSGRVYPLEDLEALAAMLRGASAHIGRAIRLICDEPYNRIVFDGRTFHSPSEVYSDTITTYSYGKTLLAPGQRIGYLTVPPTMPDREELRNRILLAQVATGGQSSGPAISRGQIYLGTGDGADRYMRAGALLRRWIDELGRHHIAAGTLLDPTGHERFDAAVAQADPLDSGRRVPKPHGAVLRPRRHALSVRRVGHRAHLALVVAQPGHGHPAAAVPDS